MRKADTTQDGRRENRPGEGGTSVGVIPSAFFLPIQGLIFVVDSNDRERVQESADELQKMVNTQRWELSPWLLDRVLCGGMEVQYTKGRRFSLVALDK